MRILLGIPLLLLPLMLLVSGETQERNDALLGIVAVKQGKSVVVAHVLKDSPASSAGLKAGDVLIRVNGRRITDPDDVDKALASAKAGSEVEVTTQRDGKERKATATLIARSAYRGDFMKVQKRGATGFKAPAWYAYAWGNVAKDAKPPTRANTKGKIVIIHAFQSW